MPCGIFYSATCHSFKPSLTIIMDNGNQYFEEKIMSKILHNPMCQILINGWQLMMSIWLHECNYYEVA
jgi:hypothetical protein